MTKCSFCGFDNQESVHFCEKCRTDLSVPFPAVQDGISDAGAMAFTLGGASELGVVPTLQLLKVPIVEPLQGKPETFCDMKLPGRSVWDPLVQGSGEPDSTPNNALPPEILPPRARPRLIVLRGEKIDEQFPLYDGKNYMGRTDEKPVDIDLDSQEPQDKIWTSRQHAVITFENGILTIEDLNSLNGTFVNRIRVHPGQVRTLQVNDIIQVGTVQLRVIIT